MASQQNEKQVQFLCIITSRVWKLAEINSMKAWCYVNVGLNILLLGLKWKRKHFLSQLTPHKLAAWRKNRICSIWITIFNWISLCKFDSVVSEHGIVASIFMRFSTFAGVDATIETTFTIKQSGKFTKPTNSNLLVHWECLAFNLKRLVKQNEYTH